MAYVGCIAGAISIEDYRQGLVAAGFADVQVVDSGSDLNAYAKAENASGCCSPASLALPVAEQVSCCAPAKSAPAAAVCCSPTEQTSQAVVCCSPTVPEPQAASCCSPTTSDDALHARLADLLRRYNVNDYAASVRVYAVKP